jgi:hypothetical protein
VVSVLYPVGCAQDTFSVSPSQWSTARAGDPKASKHDQIDPIKGDPVVNQSLAIPHLPCPLIWSRPQENQVPGRGP